MADIAFGSVEKIVKVVVEIKKAADTAKQNRKEVVQIQASVETVVAVVSELDETDATKNESMDRALANLHNTLNCALELVQDCENRNRLCLLCTARDLSQKLRRVREDIRDKLQVVQFATTVHITKRLGKANPTRRKKNTVSRRRRRAGHRPPRPQGAEEIRDYYCVDVPWGSARMLKCKLEIETGVEDASTTISGLKMFSLSELNDATNNFSDQRIIGKSGLSTVYKGVLHDGLVVALKVLCDSDSISSLGMGPSHEVKIGAKLDHKNIVKYLGYCIDVRTKLVELDNGEKVSAEKVTHVLVLDYLPNGSLKDIVEGKKLVELSSCFWIFQEIAEGVHYLHLRGVIHGDLKPDNILFDTHMQPVIIDFGISKVQEADVDEESLDSPVGTIGYMAPETIELGRLWMKSDVFAFGVCLVQTIIILSTGRRDWHNAAKDWVQEAGGIQGLLDPTVQVDESQLVQINWYLEVGWLCMNMDPAKRPSMADVVQILTGEKELPTRKNRHTHVRLASSANA